MASMMNSERSGPVPFQAHIELLQLFLAHRESIVEKLQGLLNAQGKPLQYLEDRLYLARPFEECFFSLPAITRDQSRLRGQLQEAHWASGFKPRDMPGIPNEMFDPADMMTRAFFMWRLTRWPGRNGRVRFAQTLFNLYLIRCLTLLNMRLWDAGPEHAAARLARNQQVLDQLWKSSPADQPQLVRDVRWLVPVAQSPTTDDLGPYFDVAERIAETFAESDRIEIHKAGVLMAGGHLRSQLRHFNMQGTALEDHGLLLSTRRSNALDVAMTIQGLVPLLKVYERAVQDGDSRSRRELAGAICQAISPDPELFVNRVDLLRVYSMIEHLFVTTEQGHAALTHMGQRHVALAGEYTASMARVQQALREDSPRFRPVPGGYSPYGVMFGFSSNLMEHMTVKTLQADAETRFSLEDVFADGDANADKLAWVSGWRKLPHMSQEVQKLYAYPQQFAEEVFARIERALNNAQMRSGRLFIVPVDDPVAAVAAASIAELPIQYLRSSDAEVVAAHQAQACDQARLLLDRREGEFLVSWQTAGGWMAITKDLLTEVLGAGQDVKISGLPVLPAQVLGLMCDPTTGRR